MKRYLKGYSVAWQGARVNGVCSELQSKPFTFSRHFIDRLGERLAGDDLRKALLCIRGAELSEKTCFEYHEGESGGIEKLCFAVPIADLFILKLVLSIKKQALSFWINSIYEHNGVPQGGVYERGQL
jgi:hypothetical protein